MFVLITLLSLPLAALGWRVRMLRRAQTVQFGRDEMLERLDFLHAHGYLANDEYESRRALWLEVASNTSY